MFLKRNILPTALLLSSFFLPSVLSQDHEDDDYYMRPIHYSDYEAATTGIQRREVNKQAYKLRDEAHLIYGRPMGEDSALLADLKIANQRLLILEDMDPLLSNVLCRDGLITVTFKTPGLAKEAAEDWVEEIRDSGASQAAVAITNHRGCGPDKYQRFPFKVTDVDVDELDPMSVSLKAEVMEWYEVLRDAELDFGEQTLKRPEHALVRRDESEMGVSVSTLERRGIKEWFENLGRKFVSAFDGLVDFLKNPLEKLGNNNYTANIATMKFDYGTPNNSFTLLPTAEEVKELKESGKTPSLLLDCVNCYTRGNITLSGALHFKDFVMTKMAVVLNVTGALEAVVVTNLVSDGAGDGAALTRTVPIIRPIQFGGINIKYIFELGPQIDIDLGLSLSVSSALNITTGVTTRLAAGALAQLDLVNPSETGTKNWNFTWDPFFRASSMEVSFTLDTYVQTSFGLGMIVLGGTKSKISPSMIGGFKPFEMKAGLALKAPNLSTKFTTGWDRDGFCESGGEKTGVRGEPGIKASLDFVVDKHDKGDAEPKKIWEKPDLFSVSLVKLPEFCLPVSLPFNQTETLKKEFEEAEAKKLEEEKLKAEEERKRKEEEDAINAANAPAPADGKVLGKEGKESSAYKMGPISGTFCSVVGVVGVLSLLNI